MNCNPNVGSVYLWAYIINQLWDPSPSGYLQIVIRGRIRPVFRICEQLTSGEVRPLKDINFLTHGWVRPIWDLIIFDP